MEGQEWTWEDNEGLGESSGAHLRPRREMRDTDSRDTGKAGWTDGQKGCFWLRVDTDAVRSRDGMNGRRS